MAMKKKDGEEKRMDRIKVKKGLKVVRENGERKERANDEWRGETYIIILFHSNNTFFVIYAINECL